MTTNKMALLMIMIMMMMLLAHPVHSILYKDCWLLFGDLNDIGYTHSMNLGRLETNRYLVDKYPRHTFESTAHPSVFFLPQTDRTRLVNRSISDGCNLIVASSSGLFDDAAYAREFPNVTFVAGEGQREIDDPAKEPTNLVHFGIDWFSAAFVSGAVAASVSETCGAFIAAFEKPRAPWNHAMGFALGYRWIKPTQRVHVVTMDSYYNPKAEVLAAQQLVERLGCDVLGRHTDPNDVDQYILDLATSSSTTTTTGKKKRDKALSMARYVDMSTFVGDTVFTSQVWNPFDAFLPILEESFLISRDDRTVEYSTNFTKMAPMELSPITSAVTNQSSVAEIQRLAWETLAQQNPLCGTYFRKSGKPTSPLGEGCFQFSNKQPRESYLLLPGVAYYDSFQDGGKNCGGGGQYYSYSDNLTVTCHPCPENTYQTPDARAEAETCLPCPEGTVSEPGSSECIKIVQSDGGSDSVVATAISAAIAAFVVVATLALFFVLKNRHKRDNRNAPKRASDHPIAILFTDIQASTTLWANAPAEMSRAVEAHHTLIRKIIRNRRGYEVKTIGDAFMIAHNDVREAVSIALDIQKNLHGYDWGASTKLNDVYDRITTSNDDDDDDDDEVRGGRKASASLWNGLRIRVGIAYGTCSVQKDPVTGGYDYYGNIVNTAARTEAAAHGGQVLLTSQAYHALCQKLNEGSEHRGFPTPAAAPQREQSAVQVVLSKDQTTSTPPAPSEEAMIDLGLHSVESQGRISLRGLLDPVELLELKPVGLSQREFPPLSSVEDKATSELESGGGGGGNQTAGMNSAEQQQQQQQQGQKLATSTSSAAPAVLSDSVMRANQMERLMKKSMKAAGFRRYDAELLRSATSAFHSMKAVFALYSDEERERILDDLLKKWHLRIPPLDDTELVEVGRDTPRLLVLSIRAASVVYTDNHGGGFVNFGVFSSARSSCLLDGDQSVRLLEEDEEKEEK